MIGENVKGTKGKKNMNSWSTQQNVNKSDILHEICIVLALIMSELLNVRDSKARGGRNLRGGGSGLNNCIVILQVVVFDNEVIVISKRHREKKKEERKRRLEKEK
jgi:hypothetical protein